MTASDKQSAQHESQPPNNRFSHYSIKKKLVLFTMVATLTALIIALSVIISFDRILTKNNIIEEVTSISQILATRSEVALTFQDKRSSQTNLNSLKNSPEYVLACLYGKNSELYAHFPSTRAQADCPTHSQPTDEGFESVTTQYVHQWTLIHRNGQEEIGRLYLRRSLNALNKRLSQFAGASAIITIFVLIISYLIIARLQRIISKPILDLSEISACIAQDNDYQRRATIAGQDEIGTLGLAFNKMLDTVEKAQQELKFMAFNDALTGLPNRRFFMERLETSMEDVLKSKQSLTLFLIDLDGFKGVNDTIGHDAGDMVLTTVSERMPQLLSKGDMVARLGGDEFTIILSDIATPHAIRKLALDIIKAIEEPIEFKGQRADVSASVGIAIAPMDSTSHEVLLKLADAAMYRAKAGGKKTFYFYDEHIDAQMKAFAAIEAQRFEQLTQQPGSLTYQPIIHLDSGQTFGLLVFFDFKKESLASTTPPTDHHLDDQPFKQEDHFSHIRYYVDEPLTTQLMMQTIDLLIKDIPSLNAARSTITQLHMIISLTHEQLNNPTIEEKLQQLTQTLDAHQCQLYYAVDNNSVAKVNNEALKEHMIVSDHGQGIENLNALGTGKQWCLASVPSLPLSQWQTKAWQTLNERAHESETTIIGLHIDSKAQFELSQTLDLTLAAGHYICPALQADALVDWFNKTDNNS